VFQDVNIPAANGALEEAFELYTVGISRAPIKTSGGLTVVPDYAFADAPAPKVVIVGAQGGKTPEMLAWLGKASREADVLMSVCTGAFKLGAAGVLDGKEATTHHDFYDKFASQFPKVKLIRGKRFVQSDPTVITAGGLSSGIDGALHVVEQYFGRAVAQQTADYMEYEGTGWKRN
jgi:transcriptional regulator GlxA family with amidase domain